MCCKEMKAKFGISTEILSKKVMSYPRLKQKVFFRWTVLLQQVAIAKLLQYVF